MIPCFNEAVTIGEVVRGARRLLPHVVVVDDGSTDATAAAAAAAGAQICRHPVNRGKGAALRTGLHAAWGWGFGWALALDGDGQHAPEDIPAFFARAEQTGAALVVGDRLSCGSAAQRLPPGQRSQQMPWLRRRVNHWMTRRLWRLTGVPLADSQCGFRLVNLEAWSGLELTSERFEVESEMLAAFVAAGHGVAFVPIQVIYKSQASKIHPLVDAWRWGKWWLARRR